MLCSDLLFGLHEVMDGDWFAVLDDPMTQYDDAESFEGGPPLPPSRAHMRLVEQKESGQLVKFGKMERGPTPPPSRKTHMHLKEQVRAGQLGC